MPQLGCCAPDAALPKWLTKRDLRGLLYSERQVDKTGSNGEGHGPTSS